MNPQGNAELGNQLEIIDNEKIINEQLLEGEEQNALRILKTIDAQSKYDIDLAVSRNKEKNSYYFLSGDNILNIPLEFDKLTNIGDVLIKLLNSQGHIFTGENNLYLTGRQDKRKIFNNDTIGDNDTFIHGKTTPTHGFKQDGSGEFKNIDEMIKNNNEVEEIFKFVMNIKGIPRADWNIQSMFHSTFPQEELPKVQLGFEDNNVTSGIIKILNTPSYSYSQAKKELEETPEEYSERLSTLSNMYPEPEQGPPEKTDSI